MAQRKECRAELKGIDFCDVNRTHACVAFLTQVKAQQKKCRAKLKGVDFCNVNRTHARMCCFFDTGEGTAEEMQGRAQGR
jgi:uncharacterized protein YjbI with pentapeptide repeats